MNVQPSATEPDQEAREGWVDDRQHLQSAFYSSPTYDVLLERVHRLLEEAEKVALLTAPDGAGKTTLLFRIQGDTPEHWLPCRVDANPMLHPDQLLYRLARCVDLAEADEVTSESIAAAFRELRLQGRLPVVMVDDADLLPISTLITFLRLNEQRAGDSPVCALLLLARPDIERALSTHQLHAMGTGRFERMVLPTLTFEDTPGYVRHFLRMEGVEQELDFGAQQLAMLHSESGGLPGKMNDLVNRRLRDAIVPSQNPLSERLLQNLQRIPPYTAMSGAAVLFLLLLTLLFQSRLESLLQPSDSGKVDDAEPLAEQQIEESVVEGDQKRLQPLLVPPMAEPLDVEPDAGPVTVEVIHEKPVVVPEVSAEQPVSRPSPGTVRKVAPEAKIAVTESPRTSPAPYDQPEGKQKAAPKPPPAPAKTNIVFKREAWLLKQRPQTYTLQLLAAGSEQAVRQFAQEHHLTNDVYYFKTQRNGRPWIGLLLGIYDDRKTAVSVLNMLPDSLRKAGAWPRSLRSVQEEIRQVR